MTEYRTVEGDLIEVGKKYRAVNGEWAQVVYISDKLQGLYIAAFNEDYQLDWYSEHTLGSLWKQPVTDRDQLEEKPKHCKCDEPMPTGTDIVKCRSCWGVIEPTPEKKQTFLEHVECEGSDIESYSVQALVEVISEYLEGLDDATIGEEV